MTSTQSILLIDDEIDVGEYVSDAARGLGITCKVTADAPTFWKELTPDITLILIDLMMPKTDGIELLRLLGHRSCSARIVLMSGVGKRIIETAESLARSLGLAVVGHLQKPFRLSELEAVLRLGPETGPVPHEKRSKGIVLDDSEISRAIARDEFVLHYQPQIEIATGRVFGVEALVRWQHQEHGLIFPDHFISRIDSLGLGNQLGWLVANHGVSEIGGLIGSARRDIQLSLNFSVFSLLDLSFPDTFAALAGKYDVHPECITIEITESGLIQELSHTLDVLARLRMKHFQVSIDDFGTGYSMMQQLRHIPATEIKIDRSFVANLHRAGGDRVMVQKTIEIGHELGMTVVAEGVETDEQLGFLRANGCDIAQGYLYSRPMPAEDAAHWLGRYQSVNSL